MLELKKHIYGIKKLKNLLIEIINNLERRETMITVARLHKLDNGSVLKAFADIIINNEVLVKSVQVLSGEDDGLFVSMPKQKAKNGNCTEEEHKKIMAYRFLLHLIPDDIYWAENSIG